MNLNPKNRWIIVLGSPNLSHPYWEGRTIEDLQKEDHWRLGEIFSSKRDALDCISRLGANEYHLRAQKYSSRLSMKKTIG